MGTIWTVLCSFLHCFIAAQSVVTYRDARYTQDFVGFYENLEPFSLKRNFDFTPYDTFFSSWMPDFRRLVGFSPSSNVPRVQVYCDASKLTVLVNKKTNGLKLTGEDIQLGDGCFSNGELANELVFTYGFDECGTTPVMQNGLEVFTNTLYFNLQKSSPTWWKMPSVVHVSCVTKRVKEIPNFETPPVNDEHVHIKAVNSSWTGAAEANAYKRGQVVNLQVSADTRPDEQVFIRSCFVSESPEPQARPRHAVIFNKGCATLLGSSHAITRFVASNRADVVNFVLNTSYLMSELYIHCSVLISDQRVTSGSKSCNYNVTQSRWEEASGDLNACDCCEARCKVENLPGGITAIVSTGPFVIVDEDVERTPEFSVSEPQIYSSPVPKSMRSTVPEPAGVIVSGASDSRSEFSSHPQGVVVVSQDPGTRLTLWIPEQVQNTEHGGDMGFQSEDGIDQLQPNDSITTDIPELDSSTTHLNPTSEMRGQSFSDASASDTALLTAVGGWSVPPQPAIQEESKRNRFGRSGNPGTKEEQADLPLPAEMDVRYIMLVEKPDPAESDSAAVAKEDWLQNETEDPNRNDLTKMRDEPAQQPMDGAAVPARINETPPIIRSKLAFSKAADGSQTLSYEEEVVKERRSPTGRKQLKLKGLRSAFLNLLRKMKKAE